MSSNRGGEHIFFSTESTQLSSEQKLLNIQLYIHSGCFPEENRSSVPELHPELVPELRLSTDSNIDDFIWNEDDFTFPSPPSPLKSWYLQSVSDADS